MISRKLCILIPYNEFVTELAVRCYPIIAVASFLLVWFFWD